MVAVVEKLKKSKFIWGGVVIFLLTSSISFFYIPFNENYKNVTDLGNKIAISFMESFKLLVVPATTTFIAIFITGRITKETNNLSNQVSNKNAEKNMDLINQNRIDSESGWRKNLMDIASKEIIDKSDIYRIRASLRYKEKNNKSDVTLCRLSKKIKTAKNINEIDKQFEYMSSHISYFCDDLVEKDNSIIKQKVNQDKLRIYTRYLLKTHWEHYINLTKNEEDKKESLKNVAKDTIRMIKAQTETKQCKKRWWHR